MHQLFFGKAGVGKGYNNLSAGTRRHVYVLVGIVYFLVGVQPSQLVIVEGENIQGFVSFRFRYC